MSGRIAKLVLQSGLRPDIKRVALAMALYGNDEGDNIFPSVGRIAHEVGLSLRSVERHLSELRRLGVLIPQNGIGGGRLPGGRGRSVRYWLSTEALPPLHPYDPRQPRQGCDAENLDNGDSVSRKETPTPALRTPTPATETLTPMSQNPDAGVSRSISDLSEGSVRGNRREGKRASDGVPVKAFPSEPSRLKGVPRQFEMSDRELTVALETIAYEMKAADRGDEIAYVVKRLGEIATQRAYR